MPIYRTSLPEDAGELAPNLREADVEEINAANDLGPFMSLYGGFAHSKPAMTVVDDDGTVMAMYGVVPLKLESPLKQGAIWFLSSDKMFERMGKKKYFMKHCRNQIDEICQGYDKVINFVYEKNTKHIRWIKAMGFKVADKPTKFGLKEKLFYYFTR